MKKLSIILISFIFIFKISSANTYSSDPQMFIEELINDAVNKLSDKNISKDEKAKFIEEIAIENVDINALGLYTLGELRKSTDKNSLNEYQQTFQKYFLKSLTSRLTDYSSSKLEVISSEKKSSNYTIVKSKILEYDSKPEIKIDWRVITKDPDNPLIIDLVIEGVSLAKVQKEEFNSIIQSNDGDINALFKNLKEFVEKE